MTGLPRLMQDQDKTNDAAAESKHNFDPAHQTQTAARLKYMQLTKCNLLQKFLILIYRMTHAEGQLDNPQLSSIVIDNP